MRQNEIEYVYLDGMWLQEKQLLKLAINVGSFQLAEHYLCALLFDALVKGRREVVMEVNKVREHYGVSAIPLSEEDVMDDHDMRGEIRVSASDIQAKKLFLNMDKKERIVVLRESLTLLMANYHLFIYARHWLSIYMVIRDRLLGESLSQLSFLAQAPEFYPNELPEKLVINDNTRKNFGREIDVKDRGEVYYKMRRNPQQKLCDTFWEIVKNTILTEK